MQNKPDFGNFSGYQIFGMSKKIRQIEAFKTFVYFTNFCFSFFKDLTETGFFSFFARPKKFVKSKHAKPFVIFDGLTIFSNNFRNYGNQCLRSPARFLRLKNWYVQHSCSIARPHDVKRRI